MDIGNIIRTIEAEIPIVLTDDSSISMPAYIYKKGEIVVPIDFFDSWKMVNEDDIRTVLLHELGHYRTRNDFSLADRRIEKIKHRIYDLLSGSNIYNHVDYLYFYHSLPTERAATEAGGLQLSNIYHSLTHQYGIDRINQPSFYDGLVNVSIDSEMAMRPFVELHGLVATIIKQIAAREKWDYYIQNIPVYFNEWE